MTKAKETLSNESWVNVHEDNAELGEDGPSGKAILDLFFWRKPKEYNELPPLHDYLASP